MINRLFIYKFIFIASFLGSNLSASDQVDQIEGDYLDPKTLYKVGYEGDWTEEVKQANYKNTVTQNLHQDSQANKSLFECAQHGILEAPLLLAKKFKNQAEECKKQIGNYRIKLKKRGNKKEKQQWGQQVNAQSALERKNKQRALEWFLLAYQLHWIDSGNAHNTALENIDQLITDVYKVKRKGKGKGKGKGKLSKSYSVDKVYRNDISKYQRLVDFYLIQRDNKILFYENSNPLARFDKLFFLLCYGDSPEALEEIAGHYSYDDLKGLQKEEKLHCIERLLLKSNKIMSKKIEILLKLLKNSTETELEKKLAKNLKKFQESVERNKKTISDAQLKRGSIFREEEKYEEAAECFKKSASPKGFCNLGTLYQEGHIEKGLPLDKRYQKALEYYNLSIEGHDKRHTDAAGTVPPVGNAGETATTDARSTLLNEMGIACIRQKIYTDLNDNERISRAIEYFESSNTIEGNINIKLTCEEEAYRDQNQTIITQIDKNLENANISECSPENLLKLAMFYGEKKIGKQLDPEQRSKKIIDLLKTVDDPEAFICLGADCMNKVIYLELNKNQRLDKAAKYFKQAHTGLGLCNLGVVYLQQKKYKEALESFKQSFDKEIHTHPLLNIAEMYLTGTADRRLDIEECIKAAEAYILQAQSLGAYNEDVNALIESIKLLKEQEWEQENLKEVEKPSKKTPESSKEAQTEIPPTKAQPTQKKEKAQSTKKTKREEKLEERKKKMLELLKRKNNRLNKSYENENLYRLRIEFSNKSVEKDFRKLPHSTHSKKVDEIFLDIIRKPWGTDGVGCPEVLRHEERTVFSRRINQEDRLIYEVVIVDHEKKEATISILNCHGHDMK